MALAIHINVWMDASSTRWGYKWQLFTLETIFAHVVKSDLFWSVRKRLSAVDPLSAREAEGKLKSSRNCLMFAHNTLLHCLHMQLKLDLILKDLRLQIRRTTGLWGQQQASPNRPIYRSANGAARTLIHTENKSFHISSPHSETYGKSYISSIADRTSWETSMF